MREIDTVGDTAYIHLCVRRGYRRVRGSGPGSVGQQGGLGTRFTPAFVLACSALARQRSPLSRHSALNRRRPRGPAASTPGRWPCPARSPCGGRSGRRLRATRIADMVPIPVPCRSSLPLVPLLSPGVPLLIHGSTTCGVVGRSPRRLRPSLLFRFAIRTYAAPGITSSAFDGNRARHTVAGERSSSYRIACGNRRCAASPSRPASLRRAARFAHRLPGTRVARRAR